MGDHDNLTPSYPTFDQAAAASRVLIDTVRGLGGHTRACVIHAGWIVSGFAGSQIPDTRPIMSSLVGLSEPDAKLLEGAFAAPAASADGLKAIDWLKVIDIVRRILDLLS